MTELTAPRSTSADPVVDWAGPLFAREWTRSITRYRWLLFVVPVITGFFTVPWLAGMARLQSRLASVPAEQIELFRRGFFQHVNALICCTFYAIPLGTAGTLAGIKRRHRIEFLLTTGLTNAELVLGGVIARLVFCALLLGTILPALVFFAGLGNVPVLEATKSIGGVILTATGLTAVGLVCSVYARKPEYALAATYVIAVAYLILAALSAMGVSRYPTIAAMSTALPLVGTVRVQDVADAFQSGSPLLRSGFGPDGELSAGYCLFHGALTAIGVLIALWRFRPVALAQSSPPPKARRGGPTLPPVTDRPILWKDLSVEGRIPMPPWRVAMCGLLVVLSFAPLLSLEDRPAWLTREEQINLWAAFVVSILSVTMVVWVLMRSVASVTRERDRDTLDLLLMTPLEESEIWWQKWWAAVLSVRWFVPWLLAVLVVAVWLGGLSPYHFPLPVLTVFLFVPLAAHYGLRCSVAWRTESEASAAGMAPGLFLVFVCVIGVRLPMITPHGATVEIERTVVWYGLPACWVLGTAVALLAGLLETARRDRMRAKLAAAAGPPAEHAVTRSDTDTPGARSPSGVS